MSMEYPGQYTTHSSPFPYVSHTFLMAGFLLTGNKKPLITNIARWSRA